MPNGRSILARRLATWTSITLLRRSVSPSQTSSRIVNRVTTRPARSIEQPQDVELPRRQLDLASPRGEHAGGSGSSVRSPTRSEPLVGVVRRRAVQRPQPREQLVEVERLVEVVVGAGVEPGDAVAAPRCGRSASAPACGRPASRSSAADGHAVHARAASSRARQHVVRSAASAAWRPSGPVRRRSRRGRRRRAPRARTSARRSSSSITRTRIWPSAAVVVSDRRFTIAFTMPSSYPHRRAMSDVLAVDAVGVTKTLRRPSAPSTTISLRVAQGEVYGVLGPNGAGKTTFLRMLFGLIRPDAGTIRVFGRTWAEDGVARRSTASPASSRARSSTPTSPAGRTSRASRCLDGGTRPRPARGGARGRRPRRPGRRQGRRLLLRHAPAPRRRRQPAARARGCWCSTSRPTGWTRPASATCAPWSSGSPPAG